MATTERSIVSLESVKSYLNITISDLDTFLEEWIDIASGVVEGYLNCKVQPTDVEEVLNGNGKTYLYTSWYPILDLSGATDAEKLANIQYRSAILEAWVDLLTNINYVKIDSNKPWFIKIIEEANESFPLGESNVRVKYKTGYDPIPAELQMVVTEMVARAYKESNNGQSALGLSSRGMGQGGGSDSVSFLDLTPRWEKLLNPYRRLV
jgi:hypothetical protein